MKRNDVRRRRKKGMEKAVALGSKDGREFEKVGGFSQKFRQLFTKRGEDMARLFDDIQTISI